MWAAEEPSVIIERRMWWCGGWSSSPHAHALSVWLLIHNGSEDRDLEHLNFESSDADMSLLRVADSTH